MIALLLTLSLQANFDSLKVFRAPDVVVTSTRTEISSQDSPSSVERLDVKQLRSLGYSDLGSVLSDAAGLFVKDYGPSQLSTVSIRGTAAEETLFMLDGIRLNSVQNGQVDLFLVPLSEIGTIEVAQGGSSALFGADALGGTVNLSTEPGGNPHVGLTLGAGSYGYQHSSLSAEERAGRASIGFMVQRTRARNNFDFNYSDGLNSYPMTRTGADFVWDNEFAKIVVPGSGSSTSIVLSNISADRGTPGGVTSPFYIGTQREYDGDFFSVVNHKEIVGDFLMSASAGFTYAYLRYLDPPAVPGGFYIDDFYKMLSFQPSLQFSYSTGALKAAAGLDGERDRGTSSEMTGAKIRSRFGAFASFALTFDGPLASTIHLFPSARFDWYSDFGKSLNPRLGINFRPVPSVPVNIRGSIGTSFRAPTFNELYYAGAGNPQIEPEKSVNCDAGAVFTIKGPLVLEAAADFYSINITDGIVWQPSTGTIWRPVNYRKLLSRGIESSARMNYNGFAALSANYSFGQSLDLSDPNSPAYRKQLIYLPEEQGAVVAAVSPWITTFSATIRYVSFRYVTAMNDQFLPSFTTVDVSAGAKVRVSGLMFSPFLSVKNLFDENYQVIPQYPMPLRTFYFTLGVQFNQ